MHARAPSRRDAWRPGREFTHERDDVVDKLTELYASMPEDSRCSLDGESDTSKPPFGYVGTADRSGRTDGRIAADPAAADMVAWLFAEYATGRWSLPKLSAAAQRRWCPVAATSNGRPVALSARRLAALLRNEYYVGISTDGNRKFVGAHETIVTPEAFDAVQQVLRARCRSSTRDLTNRELDVWHCGRCGKSLAAHGHTAALDPRAVADQRQACAGVVLDAQTMTDHLVAAARELQPRPEELARVREFLDASVPVAAEARRLDGDAIRRAVEAHLELLSIAPDRLQHATGTDRSDWISTLFDRLTIGPDGITSVALAPWFALLLDPALRARDVAPGLPPAASDRAAPRTRTRSTTWARPATWVRDHTVVIAAANLVVWWLAVRDLSESEFDDLGLVGALSPVAVVAPLVAIGLVGITVAAGRRTRLIAFHVACLVMTLYGLGVMSDTTLQARIVLRHEGVADAVLRTGTVSPEVDAYFNWPGFFTFLAYARDVTGLDNFAAVAMWAPVLTNLLYVIPLVVIGRAVGLDERTRWTAVVVFLLANWVGQDYLSPQALAYAVYLTITAALLVGVARDAEHAPRRAMCMVAAVIIMYASIVPSHQLTPIMVTASVAGMVVTRRLRAPGLPILMGAMLAAWLVFMSATYLSGNLRQMLDLVGDLGAAREANVTERLGGSAGHRQVVRLRLLHTGLIAVLAACGWVRSIRTGRHLASITVMAIVPVSMLFLQPYGGEMILRVYFFALPFLAIYVAMAVPMVRTMLRSEWLARVALAGATVAVIMLFFVTRYGNTRLDVFSRDERAGLAALYETAPPGSLILAAVDNLPWKDRGYEVFDHETIGRQVVPTVDPRLISQATLAAMFADRSRAAYFVATQSQQTHVDMLGGLPPTAIESTEVSLRAEPAIRVIVDLPTIRIYELPADTSEGGA